GVLISLATFGVALVLLYRLATLELGEQLAPVTVMLIAFCPVAYIFSAVYSESLFLALSVGCIWQARRGRWAWAGLLGGLAAAERNSGVMLIVPLVLLFLYGPRGDAVPVVRSSVRSWIGRLLPTYRITPQLGWTLLVPLGLAAYVVWLVIATG